MRQRKKLIGAFTALVAGFAVFQFWARDNVAARRLLDQLRGLLESEQRIERPALATAKLDADAQIELEILFAKVNMTDATCGLFANSPNECNAKVVRVASRQRIADLLRELCFAKAATVVSETRLFGKPGRAMSITYGSEVPFLIPPLGPAPSRIVYRIVGVHVGMTASAAPSGRMLLELDCELSCIGDGQTIEKPQGPINYPLLNTRRSTTMLAIADNETVLIGNLTQKGAMPVNFKVPLLADLDGIGPWFCFSWQRPIDEELIMLVTPRIVHRYRPPPEPAPMSGRPVASQ